MKRCWHGGLFNRGMLNVNCPCAGTGFGPELARFSCSSEVVCHQSLKRRFSFGNVLRSVRGPAGVWTIRSCDRARQQKKRLCALYRVDRWMLLEVCRAECRAWRIDPNISRVTQKGKLPVCGTKPCVENPRSRGHADLMQTRGGTLELTHTHLVRVVMDQLLSQPIDRERVTQEWCSLLERTTIQPSRESERRTTKTGTSVELRWNRAALALTCVRLRPGTESGSGLVSTCAGQGRPPLTLPASPVAGLGASAISAPESSAIYRQ